MKLMPLQNFTTKRASNEISAKKNYVSNNLSPSKGDTVSFTGFTGVTESNIIAKDLLEAIRLKRYEIQSLGDAGLDICLAESPFKKTGRRTITNHVYLLEEGHNFGVNPTVLR